MLVAGQKVESMIQSVHLEVELLVPKLVSSEDSELDWNITVAEQQSYCLLKQVVDYSMWLVVVEGRKLLIEFGVTPYVVLE